MTTGEAPGDDGVPRSGAVFAAGLELFGVVVAEMEPADWERPSPDAGWTARDVLGHLGTSVRMGISVMRGEEPSWSDVARPADLVDGDPSAWWRGLATEALDALQGADLELEMDTPMGRRTAGDRLAFAAIDLYVHAWDVAAAAGRTVEIPAEVIRFAHVTIDPIPEELVRGEQGAFGPAVTPPTDASPTEAFIAWTGRAPR